MSVLVIAEHDNSVLHPNYSGLLNAAFKLGKPIAVLIIGYQCESVVRDFSSEGVSLVQHILIADDLAYQYFLAENLAKVITHLCETNQYTHLLMPATNFGKDVLPRVAGLLDVAVIADIVEIIDADNFVRPVHTGTVLASIYSQDKIKLLTVRTAAFAATNKFRVNNAQNTEISIESISPVVINSGTCLIKQILHKSIRPELTTARVIVAGGRALTAEYFKLLEHIAKCLNAALGATRAAINAGLVSNDCQIGQTGKTVAPDLYIAVGISGAIHHLAGMRASKVIVAINNDENAPIFEIADYGLVADLFIVLPLLEQALKKGNQL